MKRSGRFILFLFLPFLTAAVVCLAAENRQAILEVRLKDHREAIGDFARMTVNLDAVLVSPKPGLKFWQTDWKSFAPRIPTVDLTRYTGKESVSIFRGAVSAGSFDGVHLRIKSIDAVLKKSSRGASVKNKIGPIKLAFETPAGTNTVIVLDLAVFDMSDHPPGGYELDLKGYELYTNGKLVDKIPPGP